ncbi:MAG: DNA-binding protein WhiA [Christensenellaceae bacterium]|nr:DNA-binding protein WhiA [Christensenellaceae bacterium]
MSFSSNVKQELVRLPLGKSCCVLSELSALTRTSGSLSMHGRGRVQVSYRVENKSLARRIFLLLGSGMGLKPKLYYVQQTRLGGRRACVLTLGDRDSLTLLEALHMVEEDEDGGISFRRSVPRHPMTRQCCRRAFLRAAFLGAGSMNDPERSYHFEWIAGNEGLLKELTRLLEKSGLPANAYERRGVPVVYLKSADDIAGALALMGANRSLLELEDVRVRKQVHGQAVRASSCDDNNIDRAASAAMEQIEAIRYLADHGGLDTLPEGLREAARLRLDNPGLNLTELGQLMTPPVGKSGVNHRMRRLTEAALKLKEKQSAPKQQQ